MRQTKKGGDAQADDRRRPGSRLARPVPLELVPLGSLKAAREEWEQAAEHCPNVFSTWEWASTWWRHFGDRGELRLVACKARDGRVIALLPLYASVRRPLRLLRFIGHGPADELGPVCRPEHRLRAASALDQYLQSRRDWNVFLADRLDGSVPWATPIGGTSIRREPSPSIPLDAADWDDFLSTRSANFRQQLRRRERKLIREHRLQYRLSTGDEGLDSDLQLLFDLHEARWGQASQAFSPRRRAFHREFARCAAARGWLRLWFAELDGKPVAAWYGYRYAHAEWYYQAGRDPAWEHSSIGLVLLAHTIREALSDGLSEYKLLRGGEAYKSRFSPVNEEVATLIRSRGARGSLAVAGARAALRLPKGTRKLAAAVGVHD
jgi:CelD/BcsL family acetyltransferase involved in cellulose biosynthesis